MIGRHGFAYEVGDPSAMASSNLLLMDVSWSIEKKPKKAKSR